MKIKLIMIALMVLFMFYAADSIIFKETQKTQDITLLEDRESTLFYENLKAGCLDVKNNTPLFAYMSDYSQKLRLIDHCSVISGSLYLMRADYLLKKIIPWSFVFLISGFMCGIRLRQNMRSSYLSTLHLNLYLRYAIVTAAAFVLFFMLQQYMPLIIPQIVCIISLIFLLGIYAGVLIG